MDTYQFIAAIVQSITSLAWPVAFVFSVWMFREQIAELMPRLKLKHKDTEISFRLEQAEKEAAQIPSPPATPELVPTPEEKSRYEQLAEHSPRAAILEKRAELEQAVRSLAQDFITGTESYSPKSMTLAAAIRVLRGNKIVDEGMSALLDDLRTIGNRAAHNDFDEVFTVAEALRFGKLADQAIGLLRALR
jgi:uncharacterized protein DUF4145